MNNNEFKLAKKAAKDAGLPAGDGVKRLVGNTYYHTLLVNVKGQTTRCYSYKDVRRLIKYTPVLRTVKQKHNKSNDRRSAS